MRAADLQRRVGGILPNPAAVVRLMARNTGGEVLAEQQDEWRVSLRSFSAESPPKPAPAPAGPESSLVAAG